MDPAPEALPEEREHRRREYSGPASTLGLAALIVLAVGVAIWWLELRGPGGGEDIDGAFGIVALPEALNPTGQGAAARIGRAAPNFRLATLDGGAATLTGYRGSWVLVNFWASWCGPCRGETPDLQRAWERSRDRGLVILGVNQQEPPGTVRTFVDEFRPTYPILLDRSGEVSNTYAVGRGLPVTLLIDPTGVLVRVYAGRISEADLAAIEADYLRAPGG
jgi:peroxiredoxin